MAKYSTGGGGGGGSGDACELCGREDVNLTRANVAGADLLVCSDCAPHGENRATERKKSDQEGGTRDGERTSRKKRAAQNTAKLLDSSQDRKRWEEEGTDYEEDRLPYLVKGYGERAEAARQEQGFTSEEVAAELGADEDDVLAVEQGRAARADVGGSLVREMEELLDVQLVDR